MNTVLKLIFKIIISEWVLKNKKTKLINILKRNINMLFFSKNELISYQTLPNGSK